MPHPLYEREQAVALGAVRAAAQLCQAVQQDLAALRENATLEKDDRTPVTVADFGSQALVCRALREAFPDDPVVAEEDAAVLREPSNGDLAEQVVQRVQAARPETIDQTTVQAWIDHGGADGTQERFWTLDPIDGTKGFVRGDQYAIALALIVGGRPVVAALACPNLASVPEAPQLKGLILTAVRGQGTASWLPVEDDAPAGVGVSDTKEPSEARFCESFVSAHSSHDAAVAVAERLGITTDPLRIDSQAKYAIVARGDADIYLRLPRAARGSSDRYVERIWDHGAGMLVVEEAGGRVTDVDGQPLDFSRGKGLEANRGVIATNGHLHDDVLEALKAVEA